MWFYSPFGNIAIEFRVIKHPIYICFVGYVPLRKIAIESRSIKHSFHISYTGNVPSRNISIEMRLPKHAFHSCNMGNIPSRNISIELRSVQHVRHIFQFGYIPETAMPVFVKHFHICFIVFRQLDTQLFLRQWFESNRQLVEFFKLIHDMHVIGDSYDLIYDRVHILHHNIFRQLDNIAIVFIRDMFMDNVL